MYRAWLSRQKRTRVCRHQQNQRYKLRAIQSLAITAAQLTPLLAPFSTMIKSAVFRHTKKKKKKKAQLMRSAKSRHRRPGLDTNKKQLLIGFIPIPLRITRKISPLDTYKLLLRRRKQLLTGNLTSC
jgi:isoleucyl-tRNA synthetase